MQRNHSVLSREYMYSKQLLENVEPLAWMARSLIHSLIPSRRGQCWEPFTCCACQDLGREK